MLNSWRDIPRGIWILGFVSLLMDLSSEMIHALLPVYLVTVMGASALTVGFIEGFAEATAMITKIASGALSDRLAKRKALAVVGYGLAAFTKPIFPLAASVGWVIAARVVDRVGKGIRGAPRDALVADIAPPDLRGASFGLRQSLDTVGAFAGPLVALALMTLTANNFTVVFWLAVVPAFLSVALLVAGVEEPSRHAATARPRLRADDLKRLPALYWAVVAVASVLTLARFSEAFLILRAQDIGLGVALAPLVLIVMNVVYALSAYPVGAVSDRLGRYGMLIAGTAVLIVADLVLAVATDSAMVFTGVALWGLHMGFTQGILATLVADAAPPDLRGTSFGVFNFACGLALLVASVLAGALWDGLGPAATFLGGAFLAGLALAGLAALRRPLKGGTRRSGP